MQANEFEKQVQQQMSGFRPEPSVAVWEKIEAELRRKKRRRVIFFFLLPGALALVGLSLYFTGMLNTTDHTVRQQTSAPAVQTLPDNTAVPKTTSPARSRDEAAKTKAPETSQRFSPEHSVTLNTRPSKIQLALTGSPTPKPLQPSIAGDAPARPTTYPGLLAAADQQAMLIIESTQPPKAKRNLPQPGHTETPVADGADVATQPIGAVITTDSSHGLALTKEKENPVVQPDSSKTSAPQKKASPKSWKLGLEWAVGRSANNESSFSINQQKSAGGTAYQNNSGGSTTGGPVPVTGGNSPFYFPSPIRGGWSWSLGIFAEKKLSSLLRTSIGLRYQLMSDHRQVGNRLDTAVAVNNSLADQIRGLYRGNEQYRYNNHYHLLSLPLQLSWRINPKKHLPISWNFSLTPSYLVATQALVYDTSNQGSYFRSLKPFNRFHLMTGTGLAVELGRNSRWQLGPVLNFDLRRLVNNDLDRRQYLFFGGINLRYLFPDKKKPGNATP